MKMLYKMFLLVFCFGINLAAQHVTINILPINGSDINYGLVVKIKADSATKSALGNATLRFNFDDEKLFFPRHPSKGFDFSFDGFKSKQYSCTVTKPTYNTISVNIFYKRGNPLVISDSSTELVRIKFKKQFSGADIKFDHFISEFFSRNCHNSWKIKIVF